MPNPFSILLLQGKVQHYQWGGVTFLPELLGVSNPENLPFAEYWLGVHPLGPAEVSVNNQWVALQNLIETDPETALSPYVAQQFGGLPYLLKILDIKQMLSIQVHPSKERAIEGFEREDRLGIAKNAPNRNYKDKNHKPEVMLALSEFWLLHGFKNDQQLLDILENTSEFQVLLPLFRKEGLQSLYRFIMEMDQASVNALLEPLVKRELIKRREGILSKSDPGWWVAEWYRQDTDPDWMDRGIFSIYFFNIVHMQPGDAIFQDAGVPHAYLEGQNIELMSNSDNVLRGGLTHKHIDVPELLSNIIFKAVQPEILKAKKGRDGEMVFHFPVPDFSLAYLNLPPAGYYESISVSPEIWMVLEGSIIVNHKLVVKKGESFIVFPDQAYSFENTGKTVLCKAFVPVPVDYSQHEEN